MTVSILSAAKRLGAISGWSLTNLEMQKILYLAHMFYLGRTNGEPLVSGHFEAWDYGPVHPQLYHRVKIFGRNPVQNVFVDAPDIQDGEESKIIDEAFAQLGNLGAGQLVNATHRTGGAWHINYVAHSRGNVISNTEILNEYKGID